MIKVSTILIIVLLAMTFVPFKVNSNEEKNNFSFDRSKNEGYIAYIVNSFDSKKPKPDEVEKCDCGGSKVMVHGDGHKTPCQCFNTGDGVCRCAKASEIESSFLEEDKFKTKQILMFTSDSCAPCKNFKQNEIPILKKANWKVDSALDSHIRIVNIDEDRELYDKYGKNRPIPLFVLFEKEKEVRSIIGYTSAKKVSELWTK